MAQATVRPFFSSIAVAVAASRWLPAGLALSAVLASGPSLAGSSKPFRWGVATSGFQYEGSNPDSNWKRYVDSASARGEVDPVNNAVDFWNRYEEDISNAAAMGLNTFRIGIEWARIEPRQGQWDEAALQHYDRIIQAIRDHGMTPMLTMEHYVYPGWLADQGGFLSDGAAQAFGRYAELITQRWAGNGTMWITFNEPIVFLTEDLEAGMLQIQDAPKFFDHMVEAHKLAYAAAHRADPKALVAANESFFPTIDNLTDQAFFDRVKDQLDFVGIDYYGTVALNDFSTLNQFLGDASTAKLQPVGLYESIKRYANRYHKPIYIVEIGMPSNNGQRADGVESPDFIRDTVYWVQRAVADGYDVIGYNYWSLDDNYEWGSYTPRYGLYQVEVLTDPSLARVARPGVAAYRDVVVNGGVAEGYRPVLPGNHLLCSLSDPPYSCVQPPSEDGPLARLN